MKKLNITFCSYPDFSSNAKVLYEYMVKKYNDLFKYTWVVYNEETLENLKSRNINVVLIGSEEFNKYIPTTDVFFTCEGNLDNDKKKTKNSIYIELWHGVGCKNLGYLHKNPSDSDIKGYNNIRKIVDYFVVPNEFWRVIYSAKMHIEPSRIAKLGLPVLDVLTNSPGKKILSNVLDLNLKKYSKIILYMPTYKNGFNHSDSSNVNIHNIFDFEKYDEEKLNAFLKNNNYLLCVKRHPGDNTKYNKFSSNYIFNISDEMLLKFGVSINEIINAADLMITDYSSIGIEFLYLNRPILYAVKNYEEYSMNRGLVFDNLNFWTAGPKVSTIDDLLFEISELLTNEEYFCKERKFFYDLWFSEVPINNCERICEFLFKNGKIASNVRRYFDPEIILENKIEKLTTNYESIESLLKQTEKELSDKNSELSKIYLSKRYRFISKLINLKNKLIFWKK